MTKPFIEINGRADTLTDLIIKKYIHFVIYTSRSKYLRYRQTGKIIKYQIDPPRYPFFLESHIPLNSSSYTKYKEADQHKVLGIKSQLSTGGRERRTPRKLEGKTKQKGEN